MRNIDKKYHYLYKTTNLINNKYYYGIHSTNNINDSYLGSGRKLRYSIQKYGKDNFKREIIKMFDSREELVNAEIDLITKNVLQDPLNMNIAYGGEKWNNIGIVIVKDNVGNTFTVFCDNPRYLSGELVSIHKDKVVVKDNSNNYYQVNINDSRYLSGKLKAIAKGKVVVKDKDDNVFQVDINDSRYLSGELVPISKNKAIVQDKDGNKFQVDINDSRYLSGELFSIMKNKVIVKDKGNKFICINIDDPRYLSGELKHMNNGILIVKDENGNNLKINKDDSRYLSGELVSIFKNKISVVDNNGNAFQVDISDPRYLSGELKHFFEGKNHTDKTKQLISDIEKSKLWIYNDNLKKTKRVIPSKIDMYLINGWKLGYKQEYNIRQKPIWMYNDKLKKVKRVLKQNINKWLNNGWIIGYKKEYNTKNTKNMIAVVDKDGNKFKIYKNDERLLNETVFPIHRAIKYSTQEIIDNPDILNEIHVKKGIIINKNNNIKQVNKKFLLDYLKDGWKIGNILENFIN